jgi:hypothetical protein
VTGYLRSKKGNLALAQGISWNRIRTLSTAKTDLKSYNPAMPLVCRLQTYRSSMHLLSGGCVSVSSK